MKSYRAEFLKLRHTIFYPLHIGIPILFTLMIYFIFKSRIQDNFLITVFQLLSIAMPFIIAIICGVVGEQEAGASNCQNLLISAQSRTVMMVSKLAMLMTMCALSIGLAMLGILMTSQLLWGTLGIPFPLFIQMGAALWFCSVSLYVIHLFLGFRFGVGFCSIIGFFGVIVAALGGFAPFDNTYYFIPQTWAIRMTATLDLPVSSIIFTVVLILLLMGWFNHWEGGETKDG